MGSYKVIKTNDIKATSNKTTEYLSENKVDTIILDSHVVVFTDRNDGTDTGERGLRISPDASERQDTRINLRNIQNYLGGEETKSKNTELQNESIEALKSLLSSVREGGNFVFMACKAGQDEDFVKAIYQLTEGNINLYFNLDSSPFWSPKGNVQLWTGGTPLSGNNETGEIGIDKGWIKVNESGEITKLKDNPELKGAIYIDTRAGKKGIYEM